MSVTLSIGKRVTFEEVAKVAVLKFKIVLDAGSLAHIQEKVSQDKGTKGDSSSNALTTNEKCVGSSPVVRAGLFCRLVSYFQGQSNVRSAVLQTIADLLNAEVTPCLGSSSYGVNLAAVLSGNGFCESNGQVVESKTVLSALTLTASEKESLVSYPFVEIGTGCLVAGASQNLLKTLDCLSSLSCEAIGVHTCAFDAANFEVLRQQRGQMTSAANLRLLLEGSKSVNKEKCPVEKALQFRGLPQVIGPVTDSVVVACKSLEIELNSSEASSSDSRTVYTASQAVLALSNLCVAFNVLIDASRDRTRIINQLLSTPLSPPDAAVAPTASACTTQNYFASVERLTDTLSAEVFAALSLIQQTNAAAAAEVAAKMAKLAVTAAAEEEGEGGASAPAAAAKKGAPGSKPVEDDSHLTPEQLAKVQAKRAQKAEKAAAKAASKEAKKAAGGGDAGVVLGAGATQIRGYIIQRCSSSASESESSATAGLELTKVQQLLSPFNYDEDSLFAHCAKVLEQLNSSGVKRKPKIPKGTRDYTPEQMRIREQAFLAIRRIFKRHGGVEIDTPVFELKEILTGKYGEDSKLIYDLADQGGELLSLRYDLTVPFARFLAMNSVGNIKRYHIAKVYRRDQPQLARGRYREFYQCDFDIAGSYSPMVPDAEIISVAAEILSELPVGPFLIKLNHRKILDAIFDICGVPMEKFRPICSAIDKLDKLPWAEVKAEMTEEKGLPEDVADRIGTFVLNTGKPLELWNELTAKKTFGTHVEANKAMAELRLLFTYLEAMGSLHCVSFDLSLARGLDYYTGVIYEAVLVDGTAQVGSIAAGGRYDNLVGMFSPAGVQTPCAGVSIGVERVFTIMEKKAAALKVNQGSNVQVYVACAGQGLTPEILLPERMKIAQVLWAANIVAEYSHLENPNVKKQFDDVLDRGIPFMVSFGKSELAKGVVQVKRVTDRKEKNEGGGEDVKNDNVKEVPLSELVKTLLEWGCIPLTAASDKTFLDQMKNASETA